MIVFVPLVALVVSAWTTRYLARPGSRFQILDVPNERSLHSVPVPRTGGLAVLAGLVSGAVLAATMLPLDSQLGWLALGALGIASISVLDDSYGLSARVRFLVHVGAAALLLATGFLPKSLELAGLAVEGPLAVRFVVGVLFIAWLTNLYNFMDGMDGFAGGMAVFGFSAFSLLSFAAGAPTAGAVEAAVATAALGFLTCNFPPATIFMGDVGASTLGFLAAGFSLLGARTGAFPLDVALLIFSPFIVDATVTLLRRLARREQFWKPHRTHYYQRLVQAGWGHRKTVLSEYALMLSCSVTGVAIASQPTPVRLRALAVFSLLYGLIMLVMVPSVERASRRRASEPVSSAR